MAELGGLGKYVVFWCVLLLGVPAVTLLATSSASLRHALLFAIIVSTLSGDFFDIQFLSHEHYRGPDRGYQVTLTDLLTLSLGLSLSFAQPRRITWFPFSTGLMLACFLLTLVSSVASEHPLYASFTLFRMVRLYAVYWVTVNALRCGATMALVIDALTATGLIIVGMTFWYRIQGAWRISGPFVHPNTLALYSNVMIPPLLAVGLAGRRVTSLISLTVALELLFCVLVSYSRAGILLMALSSAATLGLIFYRHNRPRVRVITAIVMVLMGLGGLKAADSIFNRFVNAPRASSESREEFNQAAAMMVQEYPVLGVGANNFSARLMDHPRYVDHTRHLEIHDRGGVCHNIYWLVAAESGLLGLLLFVWILLRFLWRAVEGGFQEGLKGTWLLAIMIGLLTAHLHGFYDWALLAQPISYQMAIFFGVIVVASDDVARQPFSLAELLRGPQTAASSR